MITFSKVSKQYGRQVLFVDASFQLNAGEKVGLVGPNGAGKTTLFRMIVGEEAPDDGELSVPKKLTVGYFRQDVEEMSGRSVLDEAIAGSGRAGVLHHELEALQHAMSEPARAGDLDKILARFGEVQEEYEHLGGYALESQAREVLHGLGFDDERIDGDVGELSGGWKMRVAMARVLLGRPDVLLMDETAARSPPTRATTISTNANAPSAKPIAKRRTPDSRRCSPKSSGSSNASPRTRRKQRRCRAASRRSTRSRRSSCRRSAGWSSSIFARRRARANRWWCWRISARRTAAASSTRAST
jgi:ABC-type Mn2+/Zn2+ transport system ATPase subunit